MTHPTPMPRRAVGAVPSRQPRWQALPVTVRDGLGGLALLALSAPALGVPGVSLGELHHEVAPWATLLLAAGQTLPLALRRTRPAVALAVVGVSFAAAQLTGAGTGPAGLGILVAIYSLAAHQREHRALVGTVALAGYALLATALQLAGSTERLVDWATFLLVLVAPWLAGQLVRRRTAEQAEREAEAAARAVRDARSRLARDLHDVVTHHVTAIVVQADSAAYLDASDVDERARTLDAVATTGRRALQELRSLLGALEQTPDPGAAPGAAPAGDVAALVEQVRSSGYPVTLVVEGAVTEISDAVAVTLYRVVQEALTNAMKHASGAPVEVTLRATDGVVVLDVTNPATSHAPPGRGRRGIDERVALLGGTSETGLDAGAFRVHVSLGTRAEP